MDEPKAIPTDGPKSAHKSRSPRKTLSLPEAPAALFSRAPQPAVVAQPPDHWPAEVRAEFADKTPLWRQYMVDRYKVMERGYTERSRALAAERKAFDGARDRLRSFAGRLAEIRGEPVQIESLVENLLEFVIAVEAAPPEARPAVILNYARTVYGLPVGAFDETIRAAMHAMHADAADIPADAPDRQAAEQAINEDIVAFADALDASGLPRHPYFAEVQDEMRDLAAVDVSKGLQPSIGDLYSAATRLNPVVSARIIRGRAPPGHATQRDVDERERIAKAKAANGSISGAGGGSSDPVGGSVAEILERAVPETGW